VLKKSFLLFFIFIYCGNAETLETISNTQITNAGIDNVPSNSSIDTTTTTLFTQFPVSSILKLSPTGDDTTSIVPQPIIGETTTTTVPKTIVGEATTTTVPQTTTTTVPQTTTTTTKIPQATTTTIPQTTTTTTTVPQTTTTTTTTTTVPQTTTTTTTTTTVPQTTTTTTTTTTVPQATINIGVTVANNSSGSVYFLNGSQDATINVTTGNKYRFDLSDPSNINHPLRFSTTQNGGEFSSNVTINGIAGNSGAYIEIEITSNTPNQLYIYCVNHFGMGGNTIIQNS